MGRQKTLERNERTGNLWLKAIVCASVAHGSARWSIDKFV